MASFGLSESEAAMADFMFPAAMITGPIAVVLGGKVLTRTLQKASTKISEVLVSHQLMLTIKDKIPTAKSMQDLLAILKQKLPTMKLKDLVNQQVRSEVLKTMAEPPRAYQPRFFGVRKLLPLVIGEGFFVALKKCMTHTTNRSPY